MAQRPPPHDSTAPSAPTGAERPILVVEDDEPLARLIEALLESAGHRVQTAGDGEHALAAVERDAPALVLLDLTLPTIDGWEVLDRLRGTEMPPPVILLSGHPDAVERARVAGAAAAVLKPFDIDDLLDTVARILAEQTAAPPASPA